MRRLLFFFRKLSGWGFENRHYFLVKCTLQFLFSVVTKVQWALIEWIHRHMSIYTSIGHSNVRNAPRSVYYVLRLNKRVAWNKKITISVHYWKTNESYKYVVHTSHSSSQNVNLKPNEKNDTHSRTLICIYIGVPILLLCCTALHVISWSIIIIWKIKHFSILGGRRKFKQV